MNEETTLTLERPVATMTPPADGQPLQGEPAQEAERYRMETFEQVVSRLEACHAELGLYGRRPGASPKGKSPTQYAAEAADQVKRSMTTEQRRSPGFQQIHDRMWTILKVLEKNERRARGRWNR